MHMESVTFRAQGERSPIIERVIKLNKVEEMLCRICFDIESEKNLLINPCKCSGSMKWVHEECLKIWILASASDIKGAACDICKEPLKMEVTLERECSCKNMKEECLKLMLLPLIICLICTIFAVIILFLVKGLKSGDINTEELVYYSLVIFACSLILCSLIVICVKTTKAAFTELKMKEWHIKSIPAALHLDETFEASHQTEVSHLETNEKSGETLRITNTIVIPETARYRGNNIVTPIINHLVLSRLNRNEESLNYFSRSNTSRSYANTTRVLDNHHDEGNEDMPGMVASASISRK